MLTLLSLGGEPLILSDRDIGPDKGAIPALLAVAGLHHYLIRQGSRLGFLSSCRVSLVKSCTLLLGYGWIYQSLPCPESARNLCHEGTRRG